MPWRLIILTMIIAVIYGDRLNNNGIHRLTSEDVKSSEEQRAAILEGIAYKNSGFDVLKDNNVNTGELKIFQPCQPTRAFERYYNLADCLTSIELQANNPRGKFSYDEKTENLDGISSLGLKTTLDSNDPDGSSLVRNNKNYAYFSSNNDIQFDLDRKRLIPPADASYNVADFYYDLLDDAKKVDVKRGTAISSIGCDCKIKNDLLDLGQKHFPRYLLNAVCQTENNQPRCWRGTCRPLEYKVKVLTFRTVKDHEQKDPSMAWLPEDLRQLWKFKTVTVAAGCFCSNV